MHNTSILSTIGWILSQVPLRLKNITMKIVHLFKILRVVLPLLILSTGISDPHEGHLVKTATNGQVYFINDSKRLPIWSGYTFEALGFNWGDINVIPNWKLNLYPEGSKLDSSDPSFTDLSQHINTSLASVPLKVDTEELGSAILNNTLVIIHGQYRSFDFTCPHIINRIVKPNMPATVLVIFNDDETDLTQLGKQCLDPPHTNIHVIWTTCESEFETCLIERGFLWAESLNQSFSFAISVRTDVLVETEIVVSSLFGQDVGFLGRFLRFEDDLKRAYQTQLRKTPSYHERLWAWVFTGGITRFTPHMIFSARESPWVVKHAHEWNKELKQFVFQLPDADSLRSQAGAHYLYKKAVADALQEIIRHYEILYLIGSTWIYYGRYEARRAVSKYLSESFAKESWGDTMEWKNVNENQVRYAFWKLGYNLVDLVNPEDYKKSFDGNDHSSLIDDENNVDLVAFLLRSCKRHPFRSECRR